MVLNEISSFIDRKTLFAMREILAVRLFSLLSLGLVMEICRLNLTFIEAETDFISFLMFF